MLRFLSIFLLAVAIPLNASASRTEADVDRLLASSEPPAGVVFELVSGDPNAWDWAAPLLKNMRDKIKARFPDLDIALVSHGSEQFFLTTDRQQEKPDAINTLNDLSGSGLDVHVCEVHSGWRDVPAEAYLGFVNVAASGPAKVNDYLALGYTLIHVKNPNDD